MCGIVAGISGRNLMPILVEGLSRLEYRGYDAAGVGFITGNEAQPSIQHTKRLGKIENLRREIESKGERCHIGIAHTRWATHGKVEQKNVHPHLSKDTVAIVHNGIIENWHEMKRELTADGYEFVSDTDSEVIAHLLHRELNKQMENPLQALHNASKMLTGAYACAILCSWHPEAVYGMKQGSPLVVGAGIDENFLCSDVYAIGQATDRYRELKDGDKVEIRADSVQVYDEHGNSVERALERATRQQSVADLGNFSSYFEKEINEQSDVLRRTVRLHSPNSSLDDLYQFIDGKGYDAIKNAKAIHIVGCGSSFNAGLTAKYWFNKLGKVPCSTFMASEYRYANVPVMEDTLLILLSQSGETADTLEALRWSKDKAYSARLGIVNIAESAIAKECDLCALTVAGREISVCSTKTFVAQLSVLALCCLCKMLSSDNKDEIARAELLYEELQAVHHKIDTVIRNSEKKLRSFAKIVMKSNGNLFLGRDDHYPMALEGALKLKEVTYLYSDGLAAGELKHGFIALVDAHTPIIGLVPENDLEQKMESALEEVAARGGEFLLIGNGKGPSNASCTRIKLPTHDPFVSPVLSAIPLQLLALYTAECLERDVDKPRNLAKSVTVE